MKCRGSETRKKITETYDVKCEAHIRLLNGQKIRSDAESEITRDYYVFICREKHTEKIIDKIVCGKVAANDFFHHTGQEPPKLFNMLHEDTRDTDYLSIDTDPRDPHCGKQKKEPNPAAVQLYNAIMILIVAWNLKPGPIYSYLEEAKKYIHYPPFLYRVERINRILERNNTSMPEILKNLKANNSNLKEYKFDRLIDIMSDSESPSRF